MSGVDIYGRAGTGGSSGISISELNTALATKLSLDGSLPMGGALDMGGSIIKNLPVTAPTDNSQAISWAQDISLVVDAVNAIALPLAGGTMTGNIAMGGKSITGMADPIAPTDASTKQYVDNNYVKK